MTAAALSDPAAARLLSWVGEPRALRNGADLSDRCDALANDMRIEVECRRGDYVLTRVTFGDLRELSAERIAELMPRLAADIRVLQEMGFPAIEAQLEALLRWRAQQDVADDETERAIDAYERARGYSLTG